MPLPQRDHFAETFPGAPAGEGGFSMSPCRSSELCELAFLAFNLSTKTATPAMPRPKPSWSFTRARVT